MYTLDGYPIVLEEHSFSISSGNSKDLINSKELIKLYSSNILKRFEDLNKNKYVKNHTIKIDKKTTIKTNLKKGGKAKKITKQNFIQLVKNTERSVLQDKSKSSKSDSIKTIRFSFYLKHKLEQDIFDYFKPETTHIFSLKSFQAKTKNIKFKIEHFDADNYNSSEYKYSIDGYITNIEVKESSSISHFLGDYNNYNSFSKSNYLNNLHSFYKEWEANKRRFDKNYRIVFKALTMRSFDDFKNLLSEFKDLSPTLLNIIETADLFNYVKSDVKDYILKIQDINNAFKVLVTDIYSYFDKSIEAPEQDTIINLQSGVSKIKKPVPSKYLSKDSKARYKIDLELYKMKQEILLNNLSNLIFSDALFLKTDIKCIKSDLNYLKFNGSNIVNEETYNSYIEFLNFKLQHNSTEIKEFTLHRDMNYLEIFKHCNISDFKLGMYSIQLLNNINNINLIKKGFVFKYV